MVQKGRIPNELKKYRCIHGYTQLSLAKKLGMNNSILISRWELGIVAPSLDSLLKLCVIYKTLIQELYIERWQMHCAELTPPCERVRIISEEKTSG